MVLRHRDFRLLWTGQLLSKLGSQLNYVALAWLVLQTTGSPVATGGVYLAQVLPNALFGWVAGVVVDRSDRRWLMGWLDGLRGALVLLLPCLHGLGCLGLGAIYAVTFAVSTLTLLFYAAERSVIPALVPEEELTEANAYAELTEQVGALLGPVLAGLLIAALASPVQILYLDGASFLLSALTLVALRWRDEARVRPRGLAQILGEAREGVVWLWEDPALRVICLTASGVNLFAAPFSVVFPVLSEVAFRGGASGFGGLMGGIGGGMLVGSLLAAPLARRVDPAWVIYGGMGWLGLSFLALASAESLALAVLWAGLAGVAISPANAVILTRVQEVTPPRLQGRVFASMFGLAGIAVPSGVALASSLLAPLGPRAVLAGMGVAVLVGGAVGKVAWARAAGQGEPVDP